MLPCGSSGRLIVSFSMLTIKPGFITSICYLGEELPGLHSVTKIHILFQFANHLSCFRAGYNLYTSPNPLRLSAKTFAVHKNGRFYGRGLQK